MPPPTSVEVSALQYSPFSSMGVSSGGYNYRVTICVSYPLSCLCTALLHVCHFPFRVLLLGARGAAARHSGGRGQSLRQSGLLHVWARVSSARGRRQDLSEDRLLERPWTHMQRYTWPLDCIKKSMLPITLRAEMYGRLININSGLILSLRPVNERRRYKVTPSLTGWAQTWNQLC